MRDVSARAANGASGSARRMAQRMGMLVAAVLLLAASAISVAAQSDLVLADGWPVDGYVEPSAFAYYQIQVPSPWPTDAAGITINVTPLGDADPDLFADWTPHPTLTTNSYRSRNWGEDTIFVPSADTAGHSTLYLSVQGYRRPANFTIVFQVEQPVQLTDGQPQYSFVHKGGYTYFNFHAVARESLAISISGTTKVFIGTSDSWVPPSNQVLWQSDYTGGAVNIHSTDSNWPANNNFHLAVLGYLDDAFFTISVTANGTATELSSGVPVVRHIESHENAYFSYTILEPACQLSLTVSAISGDPDLFVSRTERHPNPATCPYQSTACNTSMFFGADAITYEEAEVGTYYIGVNGYFASTFTLVAQTVCEGDSYNSSATQLRDGVSQHGVLGRGHYRFYSFAAPSVASDITFSVSARTGDPDMFIRADDIEPSRYSFQWASTHTGSDSVTVSSSDSRACAPSTETNQCRYFIYIYAFSDTDFYITASTPTTSILLNEGQPQVNMLQAGQKQFYTVSVNVRTWSTTPLYVAVTDLGSGNPDLYISRTNEHPDPNDDTTYQWSAVRWSDDAINIFPNDKNYCTGQCTYFVLVVADTATTYSILFHMGQPTSLSLGVPQQGNVPSAGINYYAVRLTAGYQQLQISMVAREGYANIYVSNNEEVHPNPSNSSTYQVSRPWYSGSTQLITINEGDAAACTPGNLFPRYCTYLIGVQGFTNCSYSIGAVTNDNDDPRDHATQLRSGIAQPGQVSHFGYQYFRFQVSAEGQDLAIVLSATSGDPDLYVSNVTLPMKDEGYYNWSSTHSGGDSVSILNATVGTYWIGVYGWSAQNSSFTIVATLSPAGAHPGGLGNIIQLQDGEQQNGFIPAGGQYLYYMISIPEGMSELFIAISKITGDPDIYVRYDADYPQVLPVATDFNTYQWKSSMAGDDTITRPTPAAGVYTIGVLAFASATQFSISASTGLSFQRLSDGVSRRGSVTAGGFSYFIIYMDSTSDLTITVTPMSGDPDLFVTTGANDHPNATNAYWRSTAFRADSVTIPHNDDHACIQCYYYIGVYGFFASTYTIVANFGNEQILQASVPVDGSVTVGGMVYYSFNLGAVSRSSGTVDIDVAAMSGLPNLYVSMKDEPGTTEGNYDYMQSGSFSGAHLTIDVLEACSKPSNPLTGPCILHIGVQGVWTTAYTILATVSTSTRNINLINGRATISTLEAGEYEYYTINVPDNDMDLIIAVQPFSGDADLYVSNRDDQQHPNATAAGHVWESRRAGVDSVSLHSTSAGLYYIGVYAYTATRFSVTAYANYENATAVPILLQDGVPTSAAIGQGDFLYYMFNLTGNHADLEIALSNSLGDPDLYVIACHHDCRNQFPNRTHYTWASSRFGADTITIQNPAEATYIIGVFAWATSIYSLVAVTHESAIQLVADVPFSEDLFQGQIEYFFIDVMDVSKAMTVTVTSLNGDPDLYMSMAPNTQPGPGNAEWSALSYRNDSITIPASQLQRTRYFIGVHAFLNCSFTVLASFQNSTLLQDGLPQSDVVMKEQSKYYMFRVQYTGKDVTFSLTPLSGYSLLYVANGREPVWNDPTTYDWRSYNQYSAQFIVIPANDTAACQPDPTHPNDYCTYYALVTGITDCQYSITASRGLIGQTLQDGRVVQATVGAGNYQHFKFMVNNPQADVTFSVTPFSGNPYMYILTAAADPQDHGASQSNYQWKSELDGGDSLTIPYDDSRFSLGEWHLAVYGNVQYSMFSVVASASTRTGNISTIALVDGQPLVGRIAARGEYQYYTFTPSVNHMIFSFAVAPRSGDPDMYISMYPTIPTYLNYAWQATRVGGDYLTINGADPKACGPGPRSADNPCMFIVAVRLYVASGTSGGTYTITVTSTTVQLQSGTPVYGTVSGGEYAYYYINVVSFNQPTLQVSLTAISGDPDLFASSIYQFPNRTHHEYQAQFVGSEEFTIPNPKQGTYYISVYGWGSQNASFSLTATFAQPVLLSPGQPFTDQISRYNQLKYYTIRLDVPDGVPASDLTVTVAPKVEGWIDMFLLANGTLAGPDQVNGWSSGHNDPSGGRSIIVRANDKKACWSSTCTYSLAVRAYTSPLPYAVTYYYGDAIVTLMPGTPFSASLRQGEMRYFRTIVSSLDQDISISSTQNTGVVNLYASQNEDVLPNATNWQWRAESNSTRGSHIAISHDKDLVYGQLLIGVEAVTEANFALSVTTANVMLTSGQPQSASCGKQGDVQYYFLNFQQANTKNPADYSDIIFDIAAVRTIVGQQVVTDFDMYISTEPANTMPNATNSQWTEHMHDGNQFRIRPTDKYYCLERCTYYIAVSCASGSVGGQYEITASTSDALEVLSVTAEPSHGQVSVGVGKFYEVYLQTATNFSFTLSPCFGEVDMYISSLYARPDPEEGHFEVVKNSHISEDVYDYRAAGANMLNKLFFGVWQSTKNENPPAEAMFEVTPAYLGQRAPDSPALNNADLVPVGLSSGSFKFMFAPAVSVLGTTPNDMIYTVYWMPLEGEGSNAVLYTHCGCREVQHRTGNARNISVAQSWNAQHHIEFDLKGLNDDNTYKINVLVFDPHATSGPTAYQPVTAKTGGDAPGSHGGSTSNKVILGVGIPLGLFVLAVVGYLCYRNRKMSKELSIEMHDVPAAALRKAARGATDPEVSKTERAKNFHKLLQEDEVDSSDMYVAPSGTAQRASAMDEM